MKFNLTLWENETFIVCENNKALCWCVLDKSMTLSTCKTAKKVFDTMTLPMKLEKILVFGVEIEL